MSEYTNELFMQLQRGNQWSQFAISTGVKSVLLLYQFIKRLEKESILSGGEVENFSQFISATNGKYDIMNIPYLEQDAMGGGFIKPEQLQEICGRMNALGIRYSVLPDVNGPDLRLQVAVYTEDAQKFSTFFTSYLREYLSGGEKQYRDFLNFTDGKSSIISIPDAAVDEMTEAMSKLRVDYAMMPDLNLKDGEKQIVISNTNTDSVLRAYKLYQEGLLNRGRTVPDAKVMDETAYNDTAKLTEENYIESASTEIRESMKKYHTENQLEHQEILEVADSKYYPAGGMNFQKMLSDPAFYHVTIDKEDLVDRSLHAVDMSAQYRSVFFCKVPGTDGETEKLVGFLKAHVFVWESDDRPRYIAFFPKEGAPLILGEGIEFGEIDPQFARAKDLYDKFDHKELGLSIPRYLPSLKEVPVAPPVK